MTAQEYWRKFLRSILLVVLCGAAFPFCVQRSQAQESWPLWEAYTHHFIDDHGRVIDRTAGDRTTSEGQAYAMFFALVDNDRSHFDKLLSWTEANLAHGDLTTHLPAWSWGKTNAGEWKAIDGNSASDADLWMAYTLLQAGRLWHEPRYESLGRTMADRITSEEIFHIKGLGNTIAPGTKGFQPDATHFILNPSYLPLPVLVGLKEARPQGPWASVIESLAGILTQATSKGFASDWVIAGPDGVHATAAPTQMTAGQQIPHSDGSVAHPAGSYDAIRVYLWIGLADPETERRHELLTNLNGMSDYLRTAVTPPLAVDPQGKILRADAPVGFSAAVIPYLYATNSKSEAEAQTERLKALLDPATSLYGHTAEYYDQNLALFSTGWSEQRYHFDRLGTLHVRWK